MIRLPPRFLYLQVNKRCNLRCEHCDFWMRRDDGAEAWLGGARLSDVIEEFSEMNPRGGVVLCGGEPMLSLERYFEMLRLARTHGLRACTPHRTGSSCASNFARHPHIGATANPVRQGLGAACRRRLWR